MEQGMEQETKQEIDEEDVEQIYWLDKYERDYDEETKGGL